jgi:peptidoglycan/LPS O-acetylase OafA/YrhL
MVRRVDELDGIRGIAILLVFVFHAFKRASYFTANPILNYIAKLTSIGWIGVDIFFVLSGFLITSILLQKKGEKDYFKNFYARRVLRIFPLYYLMLGIIIASMSVLEPGSQTYILERLPFYLLYQQNWLMAGGDLPSIYLLVTWSLAIEEQFYIFWPFLIYFLPKRALVIVNIGIILLSVFGRIIVALVSDNPTSTLYIAYYSTITRLDTLALGALIAIIFQESTLWQERLKKIAIPALLGATALVLTVVLMPNREELYNNIPIRLTGYSVLAIMGGSSIVISLTHDKSSLLRRFFRNKSLRFFGKYSYALYLIHPIILQIFLDLLWDAKFRGWQAYVSYLFISFCLTIILSLLSWHLLEKRMLNLKRYFE